MKTSFINTFHREALIDAAASAIPGGSNILGILNSLGISNFVTNLFGNGSGIVDWKKDDEQKRQPYEGQQAIYWTIQDGDQPAQEAKWIVEYIQWKGNLAFAKGRLTGAQMFRKMNQHGFTNVAKALAAEVDRVNGVYPSQYADTATKGTYLQNQPGAATPTATATVHSQMPNPAIGGAGMQNGTSNDTAAPTQAAIDKKKKIWLIAGIVGGVIVLGVVIFAVVKMTSKGK